GKHVWSCMKCTWIHKPKTAQIILEELKEIIDKATPNDLQILRFKLWMRDIQCEM
ncbi:MAG: cysteine-rich small domain-containing protein, partial [Candidatus Nezhaarchaeales archaeon]